MFQVNTIVLIIRVVLVTYQVHATPTIFTSTPTPCYGDVVTLVCHHPEVVINRARYFTQTPVWKVNGTTITIADGTIYTTETIADLTRTFLNINITVDHFRNKSFKYSCELILAGEKGGPTSEVETSGKVTVDPVDQLPTPVNTATFTNSTTAVLTVSFDPRCCNTAQLTVDITTNSSNATTPVVHPVNSTDPTNTTIVITDITEGVSYTASIQSVCKDNSLLEDSGVLVVNFMTNEQQDLTININGTDPTGQPSSPATVPLSVVLPIVIILVVVATFIGVIMTVTLVCWLKWERNHGQYRITDGEEKLVLLQVCDALNRHNATIHSVLGKTVSPHSPHEESPHTDIWGEFQGMKFVANFVYAITEEDVEELIQVKRNSRSDRGFLLCSKKAISTFLKARLRQEDCVFVYVKNLPWKIGSREERTFVEGFNSHFLVSEGPATDVLARGGACSSHDFEQLLFALFPFLNPNSPLESKVQTRSSRSPSPPIVQPHQRRPVYKRSTFIDGVVSVLEILHVTIVSVGNRCRRPECRGSTNCTHMGTYRPDIHCQYKEKSFVVKGKVHHLDGAVTREDVEILSQIREDVEAVCSCLVCDDLEMSEEVEKMLAPHNCLKAVVGLYSWNSMWVKNAIVALFQVLKLMNTSLAIPQDERICTPVEETKRLGDSASFRDQLVIGTLVCKSTHKSPDQNKSFETENHDWRTHGQVTEIEQEDDNVIQSSAEETTSNREEYTDNVKNANVLRRMQMKTIIPC